MLHRLALALGRTVGELERTMTAREFGDWLWFMTEQPLPDHLADVHHGQLMAMIANCNRTKDTPQFQGDAFLVLRDRRTKPSSPTPSTMPRESMADRMARVANG